MRGYWSFIKGGLEAFSVAAEVAVGAIMVAIGSPVIAALVSPWWLFATIPLGLFLVTHSVYRLHNAK